MRRALRFVAALAALAAGSSAAEAAPEPLSSLPVLARPAPPKAANAPVVGLKINTTETKHGTWTRLEADTRHGYCIASFESTASYAQSTGAAGGSGDASDVDLYRLSEKDGVATLEHARINVDFSNGETKLVGRSSTELREVARVSGHAVWAYRDGPDVFVVARGVTSGRESPTPPKGDDVAPEIPFVSVSDCPWAAARLSARAAKSGSAAFLSAEPARKDGSRFVVDASLSRVSRDPEPLLAVRVRVLERE